MSQLPPNDPYNQNSGNSNWQQPGYQQPFQKPEGMPPYNPYGGFGQQIDVPNSGGILAMGIISIVLVGIIGLILAIITLSMSGNAIRTYNQNPSSYTEASFNRVKAGRVCAIVSLCLMGCILLGVIIVVASAV
jgi:hypothetical protein